MPIGLIELSGYLLEKILNIEITILDMAKDLYEIHLNRENDLPMDNMSFIKSELDLIDFNPDIVGVSILYSTSYIFSMKMIDKAHAKWPESTIVCGGNHSTNCVKNVLSNPNVNYVVRGEGEISFTEFVRKIQNGEENPQVLGVLDRKKLKGNAEELSMLIQNLDEIPLPAHRLLDLKTYRSEAGASIMFSRGCPFRCTFCSSHTVHGRKVRFKSNERIFKEFQLLIEKYKFNYILIEDDLFAARKTEFIDLSKKITALNIPLKYRMPQGLSVAILDEDIIDAMSQMGINEAQLAIESGSPFTQKEIIKKNVSLTKAKHLIQYLRKKKFFIYVNIMFGFPGETIELIEETIDFIKTLDVDWIYFFHAQPLPGSEMYDELVTEGVIDPENIDWDGMRIGKRTIDTKEITAKELERRTYDLNIDYNFFNNPNFKNKRYDRAVEVFSQIIGFYPFHIIGYYCRALAYLKMGEKVKAESDFMNCVTWIDSEKESMRLYKRYGYRMPYLTPYLQEN